ncbi:hypothetical protein DPMN_147856 [Dreissena polymorpha]|uniref:t-SNARE coiled-coil homology domain-containing protein n=1 Tax=Dreissena polymorpha TaxID=45954 RepID=A0A9D4FCW0_DREPO|nr:hypothetical protein DPMN_147856 [Dreissena polymorpha]
MTFLARHIKLCCVAERWRRLCKRPRIFTHDGASWPTNPYNWTTNELRNSLRSIDWDVEDLEETNPKKFRIEVSELKERRDFIERTKSAVREMKSQMTSPQIRTTEDTNVRQQGVLQSLLNPKSPSKVYDNCMTILIEPQKPQQGILQSLLNPKSPSKSLLNPKSPSKVYDKYSRLDMEAERSHQSFIDDTTQHQQLIIKDQDEQLDLIGSSVGALKNMSHQIGNELEEQNRMLDDFGHEMEVTESRMDNVMKKMAKVLHMSSDKRQCCAIGVLLVILLIVIILLVVL